MQGYNVFVFLVNVSCHAGGLNYFILILSYYGVYTHLDLGALAGSQARNKVDLVSLDTKYAIIPARNIVWALPL